MGSRQQANVAMDRIGDVIGSDADFIIEGWLARATVELPDAAASSRSDTVNDLPGQLRALGRTFRGFPESPRGAGALSRNLAAEHGEQRWRLGWRIDELMRDYRILHAVVLAHLAEALGELAVEETVGVASAFDRFASDAVASYTGLVHQELQQNNAQLNTRNLRQADEIRRLALELTESEQRERNRLAAHLHDGVQQSLIAAKMLAERLGGAARPTDRQDVVGDLQRAVSEAIELTRDLTARLSPPGLMDQDLASVLRWLATDARRRFGLTVTLAAEGDCVRACLATRILVFECVRELLLNVVKHAGVREAAIHVVCGPAGRLRVEVSDRGKGGAPSRADGDAPTGIGLTSAHKRLRLLGGSLTLRSAPGQGTTAFIEAPQDVH